MNWQTDPLLRWLRALAIVAALAFMGLLIIDPARTDVTLLALLVGALTLWMGYEGTIRLPDVIAKRNGGKDTPPASETGEEKRTRETESDSD